MTNGLVNVVWFSAHSSITLPDGEWQCPLNSSGGVTKSDLGLIGSDTEESKWTLPSSGASAGSSSSSSSSNFNSNARLAVCSDTVLRWLLGGLIGFPSSILRYCIYVAVESMVMMRMAWLCTEEIRTHDPWMICWWTWWNLIGFGQADGQAYYANSCEGKMIYYEWSIHRDKQAVAMEVNVDFF